MKKTEGRKQEIRVYLSTDEKQTLLAKAAATNQRLSGYIRNCLTRRINKTAVSKEVIADRVLLSKIKSGVMLVKAIAQESTDATSREKLLNELQSLTYIVDNAIMTSMGCNEDDSSNLSEE